MTSSLLSFDLKSLLMESMSVLFPCETMMRGPLPLGGVGSGRLQREGLGYRIGKLASKFRLRTRQDLAKSETRLNEAEAEG